MVMILTAWCFVKMALRYTFKAVSMVPGTLKTSITRMKFWVIVIKIIVGNLPGERIHMRKNSRISLEEQERRGEYHSKGGNW